METNQVQDLVIAALNRRFQNGGKHLHSSSCIHNLSPVEQIEMRGKSIEWYMAVVGKMPEQITPKDWEAPPVTVDETPMEKP
ncbi:hypothetical protein [Arthrobacter roseus]|uniref:hypothetical protein n=1 Tax=Arthrobacter roseus TaxID=136274 RepID=UPI001966284F|nr:hypothetical protein [Arthrobacter roseus]MBM7847502.1 hypothetical protein [Arthrobacter roseus]